MRRYWLTWPAIAVVTGLACGQPTASQPAAPTPEAQVATPTPVSANPSASVPPPFPNPGDRYNTGVWPFVAEPPTGSALTPVEAATSVYLTIVRRDREELQAIRADLMRDLGVLNDLRREDALTDDQEVERRIVLYKLEWLDCFMPQIEAELEPLTATRRVQTFLAAGVWMVGYDDQGFWKVETLVGSWELDESQQRARLTTDGPQDAFLGQ